MNLSRNVRLSCEILAGNKLRSLLGAVGIIVGVAGIILVVSIGRGAETKLLERAKAMGTDVVIVNAAPARRVVGRTLSSDTVTSLMPVDAHALLEHCQHVIAAAPAVNKSLMARWEANNITTTVTGTTPAGLRIRNVDLQSGRSFEELEDLAHRRVAILGAGVAATLFRGTDPLAHTIRIGRVPFEIIGVMNRRGIDLHGTDQDDVIFIPLQTAMRRVLNIHYVHTLYLQAPDSSVLLQVEEEVRQVLRDRQRLPDDKPDTFVLLNQARLISTERATARAMTRLIGSLAGAALLVGSLGICAVLLLSVRDRVVEIGLRRALGAQRRDILLQFLLEATLLASAGNLAGILLGVGVTAAANGLDLFAAVVSWPAVGLGVSASLIAALAFGVYPALFAARLNPIDALRSAR